ncbi:MAG TPA: type II toxin-antitoxin system PemK/MazF family toxin [Herpetosiphonaceae bacterium]|nr:type II toxin-antitoxin system PemK/MazF family toxin [Herpetosiphonaceae bacterium]
MNVVSNNAANQALNRLQLVPLTSNTGRIYRSEALVHLNGVPHKAMADQIRTVAKERLGNYIWALPPVDMLAIEQALRMQLGLREQAASAGANVACSPPQFPYPNFEQLLYTLLDILASAELLLSLTITRQPYPRYHIAFII